MNQLQLFLPCAAGVEALLAAEVKRITGFDGKAWRAGVQLQASWRDALQLNLHSRLAQRVLIGRLRFVLRECEQGHVGRMREEH